MRAKVAVVALTLLAAACSPSPTPGPSPEPLAPDQTLSFAITQDVGDLDPALISSPADVDILRNVFSGLYRFDDRLHEQPDIATAAPQVSADGLTYTFHLRANARFSNGDPITADDFVYSWSRTAALQGDYAGMLAPIAGYADVVAGRASQLSGLTRIDDTTFTATLTRPVPQFATELGLWPFWLVDRGVIANAGEGLWTMSPATVVGSGPFRMTARTPGVSMDFAPVAGWYGGKTAGRLTHVHVQVIADTDTALGQYETGTLSLFGYGRQAMSPPGAKRFTTDAALKGQLTLVPQGVTVWLGFGMRSDPFADPSGRAGRHALSTAIDRAALAEAVCNSNTTCDAATGGLISKGLTGYLGDGNDTGAKFDAAAAKTEYAAWDPTGTKVKGLTYTYDSNPFNKAVCANLQAQWKKNLGFEVACVELDRKTFLESRDRCAYRLFRQSWAADYDDPRDWYEALFAAGGTSGACFADPSLAGLLAQDDYAGLARLLSDDSALAALLYGVQPYAIHSYVKGAGGNALYDYSWTEIRILQH